MSFSGQERLSVKMAVQSLVVLFALVACAQAGGWAVGVATAQNTSPADLVLKGTNGETVTLDDGLCYGACFSPDVSQVAYVRGSDIFVIGVDGSNPHRIKSGDMSLSGSSANTLSWTNSGHIYYSRGWSIYRVKADGSGGEEKVHTSKFQGDGDRIRQLQVCRDGSRGASWGRPNGDGHAIFYPIGNPGGDKRYSNHCMGAVSKSGTYVNTTYGSHKRTGIFKWSRLPSSITNNSNAPDGLGVGADTELSCRTSGTIWMVRFSQVDEDYICWIEKPYGFVVKVSSGQTVGKWSSFAPQDFSAGELAVGSGPSVQLASPSSGSTWMPGSTIPIEGTVSQGEAAISEVVFSVDGTRIETLTQSPYQSQWQADTEGEHTISVKVTDANGETAEHRATISVARMYAYPDSTPHALPGRIEAEHFDYGGEGLAYHDADAGNQRGTFRASEDVDVQDGASGRFLTSTEAGEWLNYSVNIAREGLYTITVNVSNGTNGGSFHLELDGQDITGAIEGSTGEYFTWEDIVVSDVALSAGTHVLTLEFDQTGHIIDYIDVQAPAPAIEVLSPNGGEEYTLGENLIVEWTCDETKVTDVIIEFSPDNGKSWTSLAPEGSIDMSSPDWGRLEVGLTTDHLSDQAIVKITEYGGSRSDASDGVFAVSNASTITTPARNAHGPAGKLRAVPIRGGVVLTAAGGQSAIPVTLLDMRGRTVFRSDGLVNTQVRLQPGTYIVEVADDVHGSVSRISIP